MIEGRTGANAGRQRQHPTSSRRAASAWFRAMNRRTPQELRVFLQVLRFVAALKKDDKARRSAWKEDQRRLRRLKNRAELLQESAGGAVTVTVNDLGSEWWGRYTYRGVSRAFAAFPAGATTRFVRAVDALSTSPRTMVEGPLAAACLLIAGRCIRVRQPVTGLEAAALAVAAKFEPPAEHANQQVEREHRWRARFRSVRPVVRSALLQHAQMLREARRFGGGRRAPKRGVKPRVPGK